MLELNIRCTRGFSLKFDRLPSQTQTLTDFSPARLRPPRLVRVAHVALDEPNPLPVSFDQGVNDVPRRRQPLGFISLTVSIQRVY